MLFKKKKAKEASGKAQPKAEENQNVKVDAFTLGGGSQQMAMKEQVEIATKYIIDFMKEHCPKVDAEKVKKAIGEKSFYISLSPNIGSVSNDKQAAIKRCQEICKERKLPEGYSEYLTKLTGALYDGPKQPVAKNIIAVDLLSLGFNIEQMGKKLDAEQLEGLNIYLFGDKDLLSGAQKMRVARGLNEIFGPHSYESYQSEPYKGFLEKLKQDVKADRDVVYESVGYKKDGSKGYEQFMQENQELQKYLVQNCDMAGDFLVGLYQTSEGFNFGAAAYTANLKGADGGIKNGVVLKDDSSNITKIHEILHAASAFTEFDMNSTGIISDFGNSSNELITEYIAMCIDGKMRQDGVSIGKQEDGGSLYQAAVPAMQEVIDSMGESLFEMYFDPDKKYSPEVSFKDTNPIEKGCKNLLEFLQNNSNCEQYVIESIASQNSGKELSQAGKDATKNMSEQQKQKADEILKDLSAATKGLASKFRKDEDKEQ